MTDHEIKALIEAFPDVDLDNLDREILVEMARRYLAAEHAKLWADSGAKYSFRRDEGAVAVDALNRAHQSARKRMQAKSRERIMFDREKVESAVNNEVVSLAQRYAAEVRGRWTVMLDIEFALPDGTKTTWRNATAEQHAMRAAYLEKRAASEIESASLHRKAASDIRNAHVRTLGEMEDAA